MALERANKLFWRLNVTVDTGAGIDIRNLDDVNGGTGNFTTEVTATHTQDNAERTFDPDTAGVTAAQNATTLQRLGWAYPVADMTPDDDTNCDAFLPANTATISFRATMNSTGGTGFPGGTHTPLWRIGIFRYNPSTDAGTLLASTTYNGLSWNLTPITGDGGTAKTGSFTIAIPATDFAQDEVLLIQFGLNTQTLANPVAGTTTFLWALEVDANNTFIQYGSSLFMNQKCALSHSLVGKGTSSRGALESALSRSATGKGSATRGALATEMARSTVGKGVATLTRETIAAKSFDLVGTGQTTRVVAAALDRDVTGIGIATGEKAVVAAKTASLVGVGTPTGEKAVVAAKEFTTVGEGSAAHSKAAALERNTIGIGAASMTREVIAAKTFSLVGIGTTTRGPNAIALARSTVGVGVSSFARTVVAAKSFNVLGEGLVTEAHPVQASRTFSLVGKGEILTTGANASRIEMPIDEVPTGGGGTTIVKKPIFIFDD